MALWDIRIYGPEFLEGTHRGRKYPAGYGGTMTVEAESKVDAILKSGLPLERIGSVRRVSKRTKRARYGRP